MPTERSVLLSISDSQWEGSLRKAISASGLRTIAVKSSSEFEDLTQRRGFLSAFFDRAKLREFSRKHRFPSPTYVVLVVDHNQASRALSLQKDGRIHDWLPMPADEQNVGAMLRRAKLFVAQATELETICATKTHMIQKDAGLLCVGKWAEIAWRWIEHVRKDDRPLLVLGEPGCGKRLLVQYLHYNSSRASAPFITVRCQDRNFVDLEKEIFGAISPRNRRAPVAMLRSKLSLAAKGTILFDKADHLPRKIQQRLASVMHTGEFSPSGGGDVFPLEARLIFTIQSSNAPTVVIKSIQRDLARLLKNSILRIPPLRERTEDFPEIIKNTLQKIRDTYGTAPDNVTNDALKSLGAHSWPGNIREMEGVLWAASVMAGKGQITEQVLSPILSGGNGTAGDEEYALETMVERRLATLFRRFGVEHLRDLHPMVVERVEKPLLSLVLKRTEGNQVRAATILGINRNTLRRKIDQYGLRVSRS